MKTINLFMALMLVAGLALSAGPVPVAQAADIDVDCTTAALIAAINTANSNGEPDTLKLAAGCTYTLTALDNNTQGPNGLPSITSEITINGNGAAIERDGAAPDFRIFYVEMFGALTLNDLTVRGGSTDSDGGGIFNQGGRVNLSNSTVSGNHAAEYGGGLFNNAGTMELTNSTVSGNHANLAGGILNDGPATLTNSTISYNSAGDLGGGIYSDSGPTVLINTIVASNSPGGDCLGLPFKFTSLGHNLDSDDTCNLTDPSDLRGVDPMLGPLANNGGPTETHALLPGSPAIDAGDDAACPSTDQRGVARPQGAACDIGAYEAVSAVTIDIKPGSDPNSLTCYNEKEVITVAILTSPYFDATTVDHTTVTFEGASEIHVHKKSGEPHRHEEDVDRDGDIDLVFHFRLGDTDLACDSTEGTLTGETFDGQAIKGIDAVRMIGHP